MADQRKRDLAGRLIRSPADLKRVLSGSAGAARAYAARLARWSQTTFRDLYLSLHSAEVHRYTLRWNTTFGLGVMAVGLLFVLTLTGLLLMLYYTPATELAYSSMKDICYIVPAGRMVRNVHRWGGHLIVVVVFLHMARVFYTSSYKRGRRLSWLVGLLLLALTVGMSFTGHLLPWDQQAYWTVAIGVNIASSPQELTDALGITGFLDLGSLQRRLLIGADEVGDSALLRFYVLHCVILPLLLAALVVFHLWRMGKLGLSRPDAVERRQTKIAAYPHAFRLELTAVMVVLACTLVLAFFFDAPLKEPANPLVPENPAKAPWYLMGLQEIVRYSPFMGGIGIPLIVLIGLGLIPYLDRRGEDYGQWFGGRPQRRAAASSVAFSALSCIAVLAFTVRFGWLRDWFPDIAQTVVTLINPGTLLLVLFALWSRAVVRRQGSIRSGAVALFTCLLVAFAILTYFAGVHRGPNWEFYWWPTQWPTW